MTATPRASQRGSHAALVLPAAVALALALASCSAEPTPSAGLSLASMSNASADSTMPMAPGGKSGMGGSTATLATPLPTGPTNGPIYVPTAAVDTAKVAALASVLGITQAPVEQPGGWTAVIPNSDPAKVQRLTVLKDEVGSWFFGTGTECDLSQSDSSDATCSSSAVAPDAAASPGDGGVTAPTCTNQAAAAVAAPAQTVLDAGGATAPAQRDATGDNCTPRFTSSPTISGLAVSGLDTSVTYNVTNAAAPSVTEASGSFATWTAEGDYPLIDAQQGWDRVAMRPMPAMAELCRVPPDGSGCLSTKETMTGGEIGLMRDVDLSSNRVVLVPAWLFTVTSTLIDPDGGPAPTTNATSTNVIAVTAIADSALQPAPTEPGVIGTATSEPGAGDSGGSSPGSPGSIGTAVPPNPADPPVPVGVPERMAGMDPAEPAPLTTN